jgi:hypothetical protein
VDAVWIDAFLTAVLRGDPGAWPAGASSEDVLRRVRYHGLAALLHERLRGGLDWPADLVRAVRDDTRNAAMWELRHQQVLIELLAGLAARGVRPLLFKGTALAYGLYGNPVWRMRGDTDLIVAPEHVAATRQVLATQRLRRDLDAGGEVISHAENWTLAGTETGIHAVDLHRRLVSGAVMSGLFGFSELLAASRPLPRLGALALGLGQVDALLLACLHRAKHDSSPYYSDGVAYLGGDRLIWLYDIHLLAAALTAAEWQAFTATAQAKGLSDICLGALKATAARLGTELPPTVLSALDVGHRIEPLSAYLGAGRVHALAMDIRAVDGVTDRLQYLRELCLPPAPYMRAKYASARVTWLPWLYARRAVEGVRKWL